MPRFVSHGLRPVIKVMYILLYVKQVNSGGAVTKEDLGRATWIFLHTLAAQVHLTFCPTTMMVFLYV